MIREIEINKKDVYVEYMNGEVEYLSYAKCKKELYESCSEEIVYHCVDNERAVNFLNSLLARYKVVDECKLVLRYPEKVQQKGGQYV